MVEKDPSSFTTQDSSHVFGHGSVRALYDLAGPAAQIVQAFTFATGGQSVAVHGQQGTIQASPIVLLTSLGYSGEFFDAAARQQYLRARFYNPANGQFNRLDPFAGNVQDPQSLHKYAYGHGNPIGNIDPTGMFSVSVAIAVTIGTGLAAITANRGIAVVESVHQGFYRYGAVGMAGRDITNHLVGLSKKIREKWQATNYSIREQIIDTITWPSLTALGAWDISELATYPNNKVLDYPHRGVACPRTVTVAGAAYYVSEVNYFLWGYIHGLSHGDGTGGLSMNGAAAYVSVYRPLGYLSYGTVRPHDGNEHGRKLWARAGWRSALLGTLITPANITGSNTASLARCIPSNTTYTGNLTATILGGTNPLSGNPIVFSAIAGAG